MAVTPLSGVLRLAGTLELSGMDFSINRHRVNAIIATAKEFMRIPESQAAVEPWCGLRACTPDGLPVIERHQRVENLIIATGHCMLGVTLAPVTGWLVAQIAGYHSPGLDIDPLRSSRFH